jgi:CubicO group peptidase (beta-lactamase class C family)
MKKHLYLFLLFILFSNLTMLGQDEKAETKMLVDSFIKAFNSDDYESVFSLFSAEMKKQLPLDKLNNFLQNLNSGAGKIYQNEFIRYEDKVAIYKLSFDDWTSQYSFSINENQKIDNVFYFVPYVEEVLSGAAINRLSNTDKKISEIQTTLIFQKSKYFPNNTQISFAFINGDNVNYYGIKRQNDSILYLKNDQSIFEIGSITKLFTANLLAKSVINKKIKLDDYINDYLSVKFKNGKKISFKSLANHSSGLPRMPSNFEVEKLDSTDVVKVRHILIPYKGSLESSKDVINTRVSAKKIADSLLTEIKSNNVKFESLLSFSSEKEISNDFGEIEFTFFDGFAPEFRDFSFENEVGSLDVVETVFGFHILEVLAKAEKKKLANLRNLPDNPYKYYDNYDLEDYLTNFLEIDKEARGKFQYSNLGMGILGYTLSQIYDLRYEELFKLNIFSKYKMKNSTFKIELVDKKLVKGLDEKGRNTSNWDLSVIASAGGVLSNVEDLAKFGIAHFDDSNAELKLLTKKTIKLDNQTDIGLGWHIINSTRSNNKWHWHDGATGGYSSSIAIDIKNKIGVLIISNVSAFNSFQGNINQLCFELMKAFKDQNGKLYYD